MILPTISIIIPVFNSEVTFKLCLESIRAQNYPTDKIEIIIVDAGSTDRTLEIAREFRVNEILENALKTGEAGKAVGVKFAKNEIIALIDSDNILAETDWLRRMVEPFQDSEIVCSEPLYYTYRKEDGFINRYCALFGMNDPICYFLGNYDRYNVISGKWTNLLVDEEDKGNYLKITILGKERIPTIGANGFLIRRKDLLSYPIGDYLFDIDIIYKLMESKGKALNNSKMKLKFAKVKIGIIHIFCKDIKTFIRKQKRRIKDYLYFSKLNLRKYPWKVARRRGLIKFAMYCLLLFPLVIQAAVGYSKKSDRAWFFHPLACLITFWVYVLETVKGLFKIKMMRRKKWNQ